MQNTETTFFAMLLSPTDDPWEPRGSASTRYAATKTLAPTHLNAPKRINALEVVPRSMSALPKYSSGGGSPAEPSVGQGCVERTLNGPRFLHNTRLDKNKTQQVISYERPD